MPQTSEPVRRVLRLSWPLELNAVVGVHRRGSGDPTYRVDNGVHWRASYTPAGPGTLALRQQGTDIVARAWGPGGPWLLETLPDYLGAHDNPEDFAPADERLAHLHRSRPGLRFGRTDRLWEALVPAVLEQKVTGREAWRAYRTLVRRYGEPAPGPMPLIVPPNQQGWCDIPSWAWHQAGAEPVRMRIIRAVGARNLDGTGDLLTVLPGIGPWTSAEITSRVFGDADAVSVGDYHLATQIGVALTGEPVDDATVLELLKPFAGHRRRACTLLLDAVRVQRRGPRMYTRDYRSF